MLSDKYQNFLYNDINPLITGLFLDAVNGKYHDENRVITREDFEKLKDTDAYVKYIWSFGNGGDTYLWGKDIEEIKQTACHALLDKELIDRRLAFVHVIKLLENSSDPTPYRIQSLESLQALTRLEALQRLETLQRLEVKNINYQEYEYQEGDVVYCDVPYEQVGKESCNDYGLLFNNKEFYSWVKKQPYQVFFSSYEISDESFYKLKVKTVASLFGATSNSKKKNEYLYSNYPINK